MTMGKRNSGINILHVFGVLIILVIAIVWWKSSSDANHKAAEEAEHLRQIQVAAEAAAQQERLRKLEEEKREFDGKVAEQKQKKEYDKAIESLAGIYARWNDALTLANSTSRIALSGPVSNLQGIRREVQALVVPDCLSDAKNSLLQGMEKINEGFIAFMGSSDVGKILAQVLFDEAKVFFMEYEEKSKTCGSL